MTNNQQQAISLERADQAAQSNFEQTSLESPIANCPARQHHVFIVPTRYALAEEAGEDDCLQAGLNTQSHPIALRRLRSGYLYFWQDDGPLVRYVVAQNSRLKQQSLDDPHGVVQSGDQVGLQLDKHRPVWLMFTEIPLLPATYGELETSATERSRRMRQVNLPQVAADLETLHCPALDKAEQLMAELIPAVKQRVLAYDYRANPDAYRESQQAVARHMMEEPTPERVQAYINTTHWLEERRRVSSSIKEEIPRRPGYWSCESWDPQATDGWLKQARVEAGGLHAVLVAVDDILGLLRDFNHEQGKISEIEEEWDEANGHKGLMAGFINSLREEDGAELAGIISYRYRERDIQLTPEQGEQLLQAQRDLKPLLDEETDINHNLRRTQGHAVADARLSALRARQEIVLQPIRTFIPSDLHGHIQAVVMNYRAAKERNMTDNRMGAQIAKHVRLDAMEEWITQVAEPHREWVASRREPVFHDTQQLLARHNEGSWFVSYTDKTHCDWLSELALNTLSELCTAGPGVTIATDLLRSPNPERPLSLIASGFTPELSEYVATADRLKTLEGALSAESQDMASSILQRLAGIDKLSWLQGLGNMENHDWGRALTRLGAAFAELEVDHLKGTVALPLAIQYFPRSLLAMMMVLKVSGGFALTTIQAGYQLTGPLGKAVWDWGNDASQRIRLGLVHQLQPIGALNAYGGALSLIALLLHGVNLAVLRSRNENREHDAVRKMEHLSTALNTAAALSAVMQNTAYARGAKEVSGRVVRLPLVTLLGFMTGSFAALAGVLDLAKLAAEQQKTSAYWSVDEWGRLLRGTGQAALAATYSTVGGYATYMFLTNRWDVARATSWFIRGTNLIGWGILLVEGLYLAWRHFTYSSEMQQFLEQCCWGDSRRWADGSEDQSKEFQALIDMLFRPRLVVETALVSNPLGGSGNRHLFSNRITDLTLILPGANPEATKLGVKLAIIDPSLPPEDLTQLWIDTMKCEWLPIQQGMGLRITGKIAKMTEQQHLEVRVLYHSPLAMMTGSVNEKSPVVGGDMGMRYLIKSNNITPHGSTEGSLPSDGLLIEQLIPEEKLHPRSNYD